MTPLAYGSWPSIITSAELTSANRSVAFPQVLDHLIYWQETVPSESRTTIYCRTQNDSAAVIPSPFSVGTRANIYGGQCWTPTPHGVAFVNKLDQRIYLATPDRVVPLSTPNSALYADFHYSPAANELIFIGEHVSDLDHSSDATIEAINLTTLKHYELWRTADFCAFPSISADGQLISWMSWSREAMNWDASTVMLAEYHQGSLDHVKALESPPTDGIFQPQLIADALWFCSDKQGWSQLYRHDLGDETTRCIFDQPRDVGRPLWLFGWSSYCFNGNTIYTLSSREGFTELWRCSLDGSDSQRIELPFSQIEDIVAFGDGVAFIAANSKTMPALCSWTEIDGLKIIRESAIFPADSRWLSVPQHLSFATSENQIAHGYYYRPHSPNHIGLASELPPLIVMAHGGPTAATTDALNYKIQFWTSRGYAVMDVNYRGSIGYGRAYREALNGHWGERDAQDVIAAAQYLLETGQVDPQRIAIKGSSAGAYTLLQALRNTSIFSAAACHYGIGDLFALEAETHKFEAGYNRTLIGPLPESQNLYEQRSPLFHADQIDTPIIFFQGLEDQVVRPEQTDRLSQALDKRRIRYAYLRFAGEGHGFKNTATIDQVLKSEHWFYAQLFGFEVNSADMPLIGDDDHEVALHHG